MTATTLVVPVGEFGQQLHYHQTGGVDDQAVRLGADLGHPGTGPQEVRRQTAAERDQVYRVTDLQSLDQRPGPPLVHAIGWVSRQSNPPRVAAHAIDCQHLGGQPEPTPSPSQAGQGLGHRLGGREAGLRADGEAPGDDLV